MERPTLLVLALCLASPAFAQAPRADAPPLESEGSYADAGEEDTDAGEQDADLGQADAEVGDEDVTAAEPATVEDAAPVVAEAPIVEEEPIAEEDAPPEETPPGLRAQPEVSIYYSSLTAARVNPLGLVSFLDMTGRLRLFESDSDILKQNFVGLGFTGGLSPAWGRFGVLAEVQPLTILRLYAQYEVLGYFSSFNLMASFPSPYSDFSDTSVRDRPEMAGLPGYSTYGGQLTVGATVQVKLGPFAARNLFRVIHGSYQLRAGDRTYYDQITDMLHPNDGWVLLNDVDALAVFDFGLVVGARWTYSHAFYDSEHFAAGEDPAAAPDNDIHRLGLIAAYTFEDNRGAPFDRPTLILIAQWHLVHRFRTGADVDTGVPYVALAFQFQGDLLGQQ